MGIRTGKEYIESLRDGRQMWIDGELIADVTKDRRFAGAAYTMAELYDMQHDPKLLDTMTYKSPSNGERVGLSFIQPKSVDDLVRRRRPGWTPLAGCSGAVRIS
jgi:4-hydroxyphenylacetate 3-monooxygenase